MIEGRRHRIGLQNHQRNGERARRAEHPRAENKEGAHDFGLLTERHHEALLSQSSM